MNQLKDVIYILHTIAKKKKKEEEKTKYKIYFFCIQLVAFYRQVLMSLMRRVQGKLIRIDMVASMGAKVAFCR